MVMQLIIYVVLPRKSRSRFVTEAKSIKLVVMECGVGLRNKTVKVVAATAQIYQDFQRNDTQSRFVDSRWGEGL